MLELCDEAVWLHEGAIRMHDKALLTVTAFEEYLHGPIKQISVPTASRAAEKSMEKPAVETAVPQAEQAHLRTLEELRALHLQEPRFMPHEGTVVLPRIEIADELKFVAPNGLSRWDSTKGLKICGFTIVSEQGETNKLVSMRPARFVAKFQAEADAQFNCRYAMAIYNHLGHCLLDIVSAEHEYSAATGEAHIVEMNFNPLQIRPGKYLVSVSVHEYGPLELLNAAARYDLMSRSFAFPVELPDSLRAIETQFYHSAEWVFQ